MTKNHVLIINPGSASGPEVVLAARNFVVRKRLPIKHRFSETLLNEIEKILKAKRLAIPDLDGVAVVLGKGSSTASRTAVAVANALNFSLKTPIIAISNEKVPNTGKGYLKLNYKNGLIKPFYEHSPHINHPDPEKMKQIAGKISYKKRRGRG